MKLRNKKTRGIYDAIIRYDGIRDGIQLELVDFTRKWENDDDRYKNYSSLAELNEEWEDYREPKSSMILNKRTLKICFETETEAAEVFKKLVAWQRLTDAGFEFDGYNGGSCVSDGNIKFSASYIFDGKFDKFKHDLDLLFGGEE